MFQFRDRGKFGFRFARHVLVRSLDLSRRETDIPRGTLHVNTMLTKTVLRILAAGLCALAVWTSTATAQIVASGLTTYVSPLNLKSLRSTE